METDNALASVTSPLQDGRGLMRGFAMPNRIKRTLPLSLRKGEASHTLSDIMNSPSNPWPALPFAEWQDTATTLHMWTQIVGKIRLTLSPWTNHSWHVTLYVTSRGLTTSPIPHGTSTFEIRFDFIDHELRILKSDGAARVLNIASAIGGEILSRSDEGASRDWNLPVTINMMPNEIENPIPFDQDEEHRSYDREYANRFWRVLVQSDRVFKEFRSRFCGKCSPVHFFWGSFDLAVTRFSRDGRRRRIPAGSRICPMQLRERRTHRR